MTPASSQTVGGAGIPKYEDAQTHSARLAKLMAVSNPMERSKCMPNLERLALLTLLWPLLWLQAWYVRRSSPQMLEQLLLLQ